MKIRRSLLKDTVIVQTYTGDGGYGPIYAAAQSVRCNVDATRRLVRTATGAEAVSEATLFVHPDDESVFTPESLVSVNGRASSVITASAQTMRGYTVAVKVTIT